MKGNLALKSLALLLGIGLVLSLSVQVSVPEEEQYTCKYAESWPIGSARVAAAEAFKSFVEVASRGRIKVEVYPAGELGTESENMDAVKMGTIQVTRGALFEKANPKFFIIGLPYLFRTYDEGIQALECPIIKEIMEGAEENGFYVPAMAVQAFRHITNNVRPIEKPADVEGLLIRVPPIDLLKRSMEAMGATAVMIPFVETYMALKTGVADGQENPCTQIVDMKFYEVQKYISFIGYHTDPDPLYISLKWYEELPDDLKEIVTEGAKVSTDFLNRAYKAVADTDCGFLRENMTANDITPENHELFVEKLKPVWDYYIGEGYFTQDEIDELLECVRGES